MRFGLAAFTAFVLLLQAGVLPAVRAANIQTHAIAKQRSDQLALSNLQGVVAGDQETATQRAVFLDRLMLSESAGRQFAKNRRSSAFGPYQFINSTWISLMRRHFPAQLKDVGRQKALSLRSDFVFARRMADIYTTENARTLRSAGLDPTYTNLRLAYLVGAQGAISVLAAKPTASVGLLLGGGVVSANPFMRGMTAQGLVARAARDLRLRPGAWLSETARKKLKLPPGVSRRRGPGFAIPCKLTLPSCRKWVALKRARLARAGRARAKRKR